MKKFYRLPTHRQVAHRNFFHDSFLFQNRNFILTFFFFFESLSMQQRFEVRYFCMAILFLTSFTSQCTQYLFYSLIPIQFYDTTNEICIYPFLHSLVTGFRFIFPFFYDIYIGNNRCYILPSTQKTAAEVLLSHIFFSQKLTLNKSGLQLAREHLILHMFWVPETLSLFLLTAKWEMNKV